MRMASIGSGKVMSCHTGLPAPVLPLQTSRQAIEGLGQYQELTSLPEYRPAVGMHLCRWRLAYLRGSAAQEVLSALAALSMFSGVSSNVACSAGVSGSPSAEACTGAPYLWLIHSAPARASAGSETWRARTGISRPTK